MELGQVAAMDPEYLMMCSHIENNSRPDQLPQDSELRRVGNILQNLSVRVLENGTKLIIKEECEIYIPKSSRQEMMRILHLSHPSEEYIVRLASQKLFWPQMRRDLHTFYSQCGNVKNI